MFETPILMLVFNRPETTQEVFEAVRKVRPTHLYVAADGPRASRTEEVRLCVEVRAIFDTVDWPCTVVRLFRDGNLGCRNAVSSGITWFFEHVEAGIILEDDCLPAPDFFPYMADLLTRYKDDERVMHISGDNFLKNGRHATLQASYYAGRISHIWGWGTWRRAWNHYNVDIPNLSQYLDGTKRFPFRSKLERQSFWPLFLEVGQNGKDTWDFQWLFAVLEHNGLCLHPAANLVSNIGYGAAGTHAQDESHFLARLPTYSLPMPIRHPEVLKLDIAADDHVLHFVFYKSGLDRFKYELKTKLKKLF